MTKYKSKEVWKVSGVIEHHSMPTDNPEEYIKSWLEGWEDSCEENDYKISKIETDNKTFAKIMIKTDYGVDSMKLEFEAQEDKKGEQNEVCINCGGKQHTETEVNHQLVRHEGGIWCQVNGELIGSKFKEEVCEIR